MVGTENLKNYNFQSFKYQNECYFSLDFNGSEKNGLKKKKINLKSISFLCFVKNTGGRGVRLKELKSVSRKLGFNNIFYAGELNTGINLMS